MNENYLTSAIKQFEYYKLLGERTIHQLEESALFWEYQKDVNSIAVIVKHLWGNMRSRWTDFLTSDGEKEWRNRDDEFEDDIKDKKELLDKWEEGWQCVLETLKNLQAEDLEKIIYIRNQGHTVVEAINRQLAHYAYHIGQVVFIGKMVKGAEWQSLSIPKGKSKHFNQRTFAGGKRRQHFSDNFLNQSKLNFEITTDLFQLRLLQQKDIPAIFAYAKDPEVARYTSWVAHRNQEDTSSFVQHVLSRMNLNSGVLHIVWGISLENDGPIVGTISFVQPTSSQARVDYALGKPYWGKGIMTAAVKSVCDWGFNNLPELIEIQSGCLSKNIGSVRVLKKAGFRVTERYESERGAKFNHEILETTKFCLSRRDWEE